MKKKYLILPALLFTLASCSGIDLNVNNDVQNANYLDQTYDFDTMESAKRLILSSTNKTNKAYTSYRANYSKTGITFNIEFCDNDLYARNIYDIGYDDNFELLINLKSDKTSWIAGKTYHFLLNGNDKSFFQVAKNGSSWGNSYASSLHAVLGENLKYSFELTDVQKDGYNGFKSEVYFSYDVLNTTFEEAYGNLTICPAMRNTHNYSTNTNWAYYSNKGCIWGNPSTFIAINEDGSFGEKRELSYDKLIIGDGLLSTGNWTSFDRDFDGIKIGNMISQESTISNWIKNIDDYSDVKVNDLIVNLGTNDLSSETAEDTFDDLKTYITKAKEIFNGANIHLLPVIYSPLNYKYIEKIDTYNELIENYAKESANVNYLDISELNGANSYNAGYYSSTSTLNYLAFNYLQSKFKSYFGLSEYNLPSIFGHNDKYYSSSSFNTVNVGGEEMVEGNGDKDQYLVFSKDANSSFEASVDLTAKEVYNSDSYPKFGFAILGEADTLFFYIDGSNGLTTQTVGYVKGKDHSSWQWANSVEKGVEINYSNNNYTNLKVTRSDGVIHMFVNGNEVFKNSSIFKSDENLTVSILSFNSDILLKNYTIK